MDRLEKKKKTKLLEMVPYPITVNVGSFGSRPTFCGNPQVLEGGMEAAAYFCDPHPDSFPPIYLRVDPVLFCSFLFPTPAAVLLERMPKIIQMFPLVRGLHSNCYRINTMVLVWQGSKESTLR